MKRKNGKNIDLTDSQRKQCNAIIHSASVAAGGVGAGMAQIPLADSALITPIQITMIVSLGKVFGQKLTEAAAKALLGGFAASFAGRAVSQVLVGWIPGVGNAVNTATAAGITEAVGWMAVEHFKNNNTVVFSVEEESEQVSEEPEPLSEEPVMTKEEAEAILKRNEELAEEYIDGKKSVKGNEDELSKLRDYFLSEQEKASARKDGGEEAKRLDKIIEGLLALSSL